VDTVWDAMGSVLAEGRLAAPDSGKANHALPQVAEDGPIPAVHGDVRWRRIDLA
jgi:hypothetical protein